MEVVNGLGASAFNIKGDRLTPEMLRKCHESGIPVALFTVSKKRHSQNTVERGADAIFTDLPDRLPKYLAKRKARAAVFIPATVNPRS